MGSSDEAHHSSISQLPGTWYLDLTETHRISKSKHGLENSEPFVLTHYWKSMMVVAGLTGASTSAC